MKIYEFLWPEDRVAHIAQHGVRPEEVEDMCFGRALVQRTKSTGANPVYYVLGQTAAGRYLFCVVIQFPDGKGFPVTARPMTRKEQRRFNNGKTDEHSKDTPHRFNCRAGKVLGYARPDGF